MSWKVHRICARCGRKFDFDATVTPKPWPETCALCDEAELAEPVPQDVRIDSVLHLDGAFELNEDLILDASGVTFPVIDTRADRASGSTPC